MIGRTENYERGQSSPIRPRGYPTAAKLILTRTAEPPRLFPCARLYPSGAALPGARGVFPLREWPWSGQRVNVRAGQVRFLPPCQISLRRQAAKHATQDFAKFLSFAASIIGVRHPSRMEMRRGKSSEDEYAQK